ncbi:MAG TPA: hypothetical protein VG078_06105 [Acidimicrobiales bacterium]|nr:hypothetical protein [Acidimicrobiales bacterium]
MKLRAQYKALRSFHRTVKPLGRTSDGHLLFAVDSLELVLPEGARHFHRVLACSRCGKEMVEWDRAVTRPHDLSVRRRERLCETCSAVPPPGETAHPDLETSPALDLPEVDPEEDATIAEARHVETE